MDFEWMEIIKYFAAALGGGGISGIAFHKYNKKNVIANSKKIENEAYQGFIDTIKQQQDLLQTSNDTYEKIFKKKDQMVNDLVELTKSYKIQLDDNSQRISFLIEEQEKMRKKNSEISLENVEMARKIKGMEAAIKREISDKRQAQKYICQVEDCELRKPPLGTFGNEQE